MDKIKVIDGHIANKQKKIINGSFDCSGKDLTSLEGGPEVVNGNFFCNWNLLTSLKGCPKTIKGYFDCRVNPNLTDISDLPEGTLVLDISGCPKVKTFPKNIKDSLTIAFNDKRILNRIKKLSYLEIVEEDFDNIWKHYLITVKEKSLGHKMLEAL